MTGEELDRRLFALMRARGDRYVTAREALLAEPEASPGIEALAVTDPAPSALVAEEMAHADTRATEIGAESAARRALLQPSSIEEPGFRDVWRPLLAQVLEGWLHRREELERAAGLIAHTVRPPAGTGAPMTTEPWRVSTILQHGPIVVPIAIELLVFARALPSEREVGTAFAVIERARDPIAREPLLAIADDPSQPPRTREIATRIAALVFEDERALALARARAFHPLPRRRGRPAWVAALSVVVEAHATGIALCPELAARLRERFEDPAITAAQRGEVLDHMIRVGDRSIVPELVERVEPTEPSAPVEGAEEIEEVVEEPTPLEPLAPSLVYPWFRALARLGAPQTIPLLQRVANDPDRTADERDAAASALHAIGQSRFPTP